MAKKAKSKQLILSFGWGGWRPGAGRKPTKRRNKRVLHRKRPEVSSRYPLHITLKMRRDVRNLRTKKCSQIIREALVAACQKDGFGIIDWSIQGNHLHLNAEADSSVALSRAMQGFCIRVARGINRLSGREGSVFLERYHVRALRTPREVRNARAYVLNNARRHASQQGKSKPKGWVDPYSSWAWFDGWRDLPAELDEQARDHRDEVESPVCEPQSWLMRVGWRKHGLVRVDEVPASCGE